MSLKIPELTRLAFRKDDPDTRALLLCVAARVPSEMVLESSAPDERSLAVEIAMWKLHAGEEDTLRATIESDLAFSMGPDKETWERGFVAAMFESTLIPQEVLQAAFDETWRTEDFDKLFDDLVSYRRATPLRVCVRAMTLDGEVLTCPVDADPAALAREASRVRMGECPRSQATSWLLDAGWKSDGVGVIPAEVHDLPDGGQLAIYLTIGRVTPYDALAEADAFARELGYSVFLPSDSDLMDRVLPPLIWTETDRDVWEARKENITLYTIRRDSRGFRVPTVPEDGDPAYLKTLKGAQDMVWGHHAYRTFLTMGPDVVAALRSAFPRGNRAAD